MGDTCFDCGADIIFRRVEGRNIPIHIDGQWCPGSDCEYGADTCRQIRCPDCKATVWRIRYNGGVVWFDELGPPWVKHPCYGDFGWKPPKRNPKGAFLCFVSKHAERGKKTTQLTLLRLDGDLSTPSKCKVRMPQHISSAGGLLAVLQSAETLSLSDGRVLRVRTAEPASTSSRLRTQKSSRSGAVTARPPRTGRAKKKKPILRKKAAPAGCPFCDPNSDNIIIGKKYCIAVPDEYPVAVRHILVVPKQHAASVFDLPPGVQAALWHLVAEVRALLLADGADSVNVGINDGEAAGQTVAHAHIHVIPRRIGDVPDPRGGVRWVLPEKADYWTDKES